MSKFFFFSLQKIWIVSGSLESHSSYMNLTNTTVFRKKLLSCIVYIGYKVTNWFHLLLVFIIWGFRRYELTKQSLAIIDCGEIWLLKSNVSGRKPFLRQHLFSVMTSFEDSTSCCCRNQYNTIPVTLKNVIFWLTNVEVMNSV